MTDLHLALVTEWRRSCSGKAASRGRKRRTGICGIRAVPGRPGVRYYATGKGARGQGGERVRRLHGGVPRLPRARLLAEAQNTLWNVRSLLGGDDPSGTSRFIATRRSTVLGTGLPEAAPRAFCVSSVLGATPARAAMLRAALISLSRTKLQPDIRMFVLEVSVWLSPRRRLNTFGLLAPIDR